MLFGISIGRNGELLREGHVLRPDRSHRHGRHFFVDPGDGLLKDPAWFWRDQGQLVALGKRHLGRKEAAR